MLRAGRRTVLQLKNKNGKALNVHQRQMSNGSSGGSGLRTFGIIGGVALVCSGGTVAYASTNPDFRRQLENNVPGGKSILDAVLGATSETDTIKPIKQKISTTAESDPFEKPLLKKKKPIEEESSGDKELSSVLEKQESLALEALTKASTPQDTTEQSLEYKNVPIPDPEVSTPALQPTIEESAPPSLPTPPVVGETPPVEVEKTVKKKKKKRKAKNVEEDSAVMTAYKESPKIDGEKILEEIHKEKTAEDAANSAILEDMLSGCSVACANAIVSNSSAANAVATHSSLLRTAIDDATASADEKSLQWVDVSQAAAVKEKKLLDAYTTYNKAIEELAKIKSAIDQTNIGNSEMKRAVLSIQQNCIDLTKDLEEAKSKVARHITEADALVTYQGLLEDAKSGLQKKMSLPAGKVEEDWRRESKKMSKNEEVEMLRHMHRKVEELQDEMTKERLNAARLLEETIASIREETEQQVEKDAEAKMNVVLYENRLSYEQKLTEAQQSFEEELDARLRKQTVLHAEHLAEALAYMDKQAADKYEKALQTELERQQEIFEQTYDEQKAMFDNHIAAARDEFQSNLNIALARVEGIKKTIDGRAFVENESRKAQELSLACDSLLVALRYGKQGNPLPLKTQVETVKKVYKEHPDIEALSNSLSTEAAERGVFPEEIIRTSFQRIAKICRRVSMVDENKNSLFIYFISCLKSFLTVSKAANEPPPELDEASLDVFSIVSYANYCVQHGDIEQAVRFLNQLKGEPRKVAEGWLKEARLYLETKQTVSALCALSNAIVIGAQLEE